MTKRSTRRMQKTRRTRRTRRYKKRHHHRGRRYKGGTNSTSSWGGEVYGTNQIAAGPESGNAILMRQNGTTGGMSMRKGGNMISTLAVPTVLMAANHMYGNKRQKHHHHRRTSRQTRRH